MIYDLCMGVPVLCVPLMIYDLCMGGACSVCTTDDILYDLCMGVPVLCVPLMIYDLWMRIETFMDIILS